MARIPMSPVKGYRLYVNLSASEVRRRLKGFGHGVKKIESAGKGRAVVIHTATGRHLEELKSAFADAQVSESEHDLRED
jgi:DNA transformation protein and related proteins